MVPDIIAEQPHMIFADVFSLDHDSIQHLMHFLRAPAPAGLRRPLALMMRSMLALMTKAKINPLFLIPSKIASTGRLTPAARLYVSWPSLNFVMASIAGASSLSASA